MHHLFTRIKEPFLLRFKGPFLVCIEGLFIFIRIKGLFYAFYFKKFYVHQRTISYVRTKDHTIYFYAHQRTILFEIIFTYIFTYIKGSFLSAHQRPFNFKKNLRIKAILHHLFTRIKGPFLLRFEGYFISNNQRTISYIRIEDHLISKKLRRYNFCWQVKRHYTFSLFSLTSKSGAIISRWLVTHNYSLVSQ